MGASLIPVPDTRAAVDATRAVPPPAPNMVRQIMAAVQQGLKDGYSRDEISSALQGRYGFTLDAFEQQTKVSPENVSRAAKMGATLGFLDEWMGAEQGLGRQIRKGARAVGLPVPAEDLPTYREARAAVRQPYEMFRAGHPVVSGAAEIGGGLLAPGLGVAGTAARTPGLLGALRAGAGYGAASGALAGAGYAPELRDVPGAATRGAVAGGITGGLLGLGGEGLARVLRGSSGARLERAIEAGGGRPALRQKATEATAAGRGEFPVGALNPYLAGEGEFAATRLPAVRAQQRARLGELRASEADRLIGDVSELTGAPAVGREALVAARGAQFGPLYRAIGTTARPLTEAQTQQLQSIINRPYVSKALQEAVDEGVLAGQVDRPLTTLKVTVQGMHGPTVKPVAASFDALNNLRSHLRGAQERAFTAGDGARATAFRAAADDLERVIEEAVPEFRAVQTAYRDASRPINIIDLAKLETSRQGRAAPALDRAGRQLRADLLDAFGSETRYQNFMRRVALEGDLAEFQGQAVGGSATAPRLLGEGGIQAEDLQAIIYPARLPARIGTRVIPRQLHQRAARDIAPLVFGRSADIDAILRKLDALRARQSAGPITRGLLPVTGGLLSGRQ